VIVSWLLVPNELNAVRRLPDGQLLLIMRPVISESLWLNALFGQAAHG
jgi:hypothetical protein